MDKFKDLAELLTDMLIKQDQTNERVDQVVERLNRTNEILLDTRNILSDFMGVSVKQWEEQAYFNRQIFEKVESVEKLLIRLLNLEDRVKHLEQMEQRLEEKTKNISAIEERLAKVENLLKAS